MIKCSAKNFTISAKDSSHYPTKNEVHDAILHYCSKLEKECKFINENDPFNFIVDNYKYKAIIYAARIGFLIRCKRVD